MSLEFKLVTFQEHHFFFLPSFLPSLPSFFIFLSVFLSPFIASYPPSYPLRSFIFIEVMLIYNIRDVSRVNILFLLRSPPQHAHHPNLVSLCHHQLIPITHVILLLSPSPLATTTLFSVTFPILQADRLSASKLQI